MIIQSHEIEGEFYKRTMTKPCFIGEGVGKLMENISQRCRRQLQLKENVEIDVAVCYKIE